jgi:hypothetical protein
MSAIFDTSMDFASKTGGREEEGGIDELPLVRDSIGHGGTDAEPRRILPRRISRWGKGENELLRMAGRASFRCAAEERGAKAAQPRRRAMTKQRDLKKLIRQRQVKTGEAYTTARLHVLGGNSEPLGTPTDDGQAEPPLRVEAVVLKVSDQSARVRIFGETEQVTLRTSGYDAWNIVPRQIATVHVGRRWTWRGDPYASGKIESARVDIPKLGLDPLPLSGGEMHRSEEEAERGAALH